MSEKPNNTALYEAISDLIHYCSENELPRTEEMLIVCISMLCQEEGSRNSLDTNKICTSPKSRLPAAQIHQDQRLDAPAISRKQSHVSANPETF